MRQNQQAFPSHDPLLRFSLAAFSFSGGFFLYLLIEKLFKLFSHSATHWSMGLCAGLTFLFLLILDRKPLPLWSKALLGGLFVTLLELPAGLLLNRYYRMGVWDYSTQPLNYHGQICLSFSLLWCAASLAILWVNRTLTRRICFFWHMAGEKKTAPDMQEKSTNRQGKKDESD